MKQIIELTIRKIRYSEKYVEFWFFEQKNKPDTYLLASKYDILYKSFGCMKPELAEIIGCVSVWEKIGYNFFLKKIYTKRKAKNSTALPKIN